MRVGGKWEKHPFPLVLIYVTASQTTTDHIVTSACALPAFSCHIVKTFEMPLPSYGFIDVNTDLWVYEGVGEGPCVAQRLHLCTHREHEYAFTALTSENIVMSNIAPAAYGLWECLQFVN